LKTININLIGEFGKAEKIREDRLLLSPEETVDDKVKFISVAVILGSCALFAICSIIWLFSFYSIRQNKLELVNIQNKAAVVQRKLDKTSKIAKNLDLLKKDLQVKELVYNQMKDSKSQWYKILKDIGNTIPKSIKINKIAKSKSTGTTTDKGIISIKGQISASKGYNPLKIISYFALNLNEQSKLNSTLYDSKIASVEYSPQKRMYTFTIETHIKSNSQPDNNKGQN